MCSQNQQIYFPFQLLETAKDTCFIINNNVITNQKFLSDIHKTKENLISLSCQKIALCFQDSYLFSVALFSCLFSRKIPVLLPNNHQGTIDKLNNEFDFVLNPQTLKKFHSNNKQPRDIGIKINQKILLFTSGSTGQPKLVTRTIEQLISEINVLDKTFYTDKTMRNIYSTVSHQHIYGLLFFILWPLFKRYIIRLPILEYPEQMEDIQQSEKTKISIVSSPALLKRLDSTKHNNNQIMIFSSGGELNKTHADNIGKIFTQYPYEIYGSTETGGIAYRQQNLTDDWSVFEKVSVKVNKSTQQLIIHSPFFCDNNQYITTSDLVQIFPKVNKLKLLGRMDTIVKIEEKRLSLTEMEIHLLHQQFIQDCKIVPLSRNRQYTGAVIVLNQTGKIFFNKHKKYQLNSIIQQHLKRYYDTILIPKKFRYVDQIPTNPQGKTLLSEIKLLFESSE